MMMERKQRRQWARRVQKVGGDFESYVSHTIQFGLAALTDLGQGRQVMEQTRSI